MKTTLLLAHLVAFACCPGAANAGRLVKRTAYPQSCMINVKCPNNQEQTSSCAKADESWPSGDLTCGQQSVKLHFFTTMADGIMRQTSEARSKQPPPSNMQTSCSANEIYSYSHGNIRVFYAMKTECSCASGVDPKCTTQSKSAEACNFTQIKFCGATVDKQVCS